MKNILKNIKSNPLILGIIGSIIGGILILFGIPLARLFLKLLFSWSNRFSRFIINITIELAIADSNLTDLIIFTLVLWIFVWVMFSILLPETRNIKKLRGENILIIIYFILLFFLVSICIIDNIGEIINVSQKLRMGIIAPYIDDQKEEELWSKWYLIRSKIDYISLNYELDNIAKNNNIELPKPYY